MSARAFMGSWGRSFVLGAFTSSCALDLPQPPDTRAREVSFEGSTDADAGVPTVFLARSPTSQAPLPRLFEGILSDYHRAHADDVELSSTLAVRQIPLWADRKGDTQTLIPLSPLLPRSQYSLVIAAGRSVEFVTRRAEPRLMRVWPSDNATPNAGGVALRSAVYCARLAPASALLEGAQDLSVLDVLADVARSPTPSWPSELSDEFRLYAGSHARWSAVAGRSSCKRVSIEGALPANGDVVPPRLDGVLVQPALFTQSTHETPTSAVCEAALALGTGCAVVHDDRVLVRDDLSAALWCFSGAFAGCVTTEPGRGATIRGLQPQTQYVVGLEVIHADGVVWASAPEIETAPGRPHVVINEVLANPNGPEPQQEWVELYNDGRAAVELGGWQLADSSASSELPSVLLAAGAYVLLVNEGFLNPPDLDVAPPFDATLLALPRLATGGLANSGEGLRLIAPDGSVASRWPALSSMAGVSLARRAPSATEAPDVDILPHADPGASPAMPNVVVAP